MVDGPRSSGTLRRSGRNVSIRTVASSQAASSNVAAGQSPVAAPSIAGSGTNDPGLPSWRPPPSQPLRPSGADTIGYANQPRTAQELMEKSIDPYADYSIPLNPRSAEQYPDAYNVGGLNPRPAAPKWAAADPSTQAYWDQYGDAINNLNLIYDGATETNINLLRGMVDEDEVRASMESQWLNMEVMRQTNKAMADQMIADAIDQAAQPYDEKLLGVDRSIEDIRGKMDDLQKITDYYMASLVEPWERAAAAGRNTTGDDIRGKIGGRIADIGKVYDLANSKTQAYLDRIGGVPVAQQVAINDAIHEMQSPFEGLTEAESLAAAKIIDATGNLYDKQAMWGLANAQWEAEAQRFVTGSSLQRAMKDLDQQRDDIIGFRARAVARAERQANEQYGYQEQMPTLEEFQALALSGVGAELGLDAFETADMMSTFNKLMTGGWIDSQLAGLLDPIEDAKFFDPTTGELLGTAFRNTAALEDFLSHLENSGGEFDGEIKNLLYTMQVWEAAGQSWAERDKYYRSGGGQKRGSQAPNNYANKDHPEYLQRKAYTSSMQQLILDNFNVYSNGMADQMRYEVDPSNTAQDPNSDHLSGGALDLWPVNGDLEEMDRLERWLQSQPNVSFTRWRTSGHHDHLHVSFLLPSQIGGGAVIGDEGYVSGPGAMSTVRADVQVQSALESVDSTTRSLLQKYLGADSGVYP